MTLHYNPNGKYTKNVGKITVLKKGINGLYVGSYENETNKVISNFFPDNATEEQLNNALNEAMHNPVMNVTKTLDGGKRYIGKADNGWIIVVYLKENNDILELYPLILEN